MDPEDIANCHFVPMSSIEKAVNYIENERVITFNNCKRDLCKLQRGYSAANRHSRRKTVLIHRFHIALHRAIYSHDWNKLLYLLKKSPIWEWHSTQLEAMPIYVRALIILLMYHPSAQAQDLLNDYFHMVCTCRSDTEKKALMKLILTLPEKIIQKVYNYHKQCVWFQDAINDIKL